MTRIAHTFHLLLHACMIHWSIGTYVLAPLPLLLLQLLLPGDALEDNRMIRCCALQIVLYAAAAPSHDDMSEWRRKKLLLDRAL